MVAIGGDEDEQRRLDLHQPLDHRKAVEARHLDVEEDEIGLVGLDRADRLAAVRAGVDDLDVVMRLQPQLQALDGQRLVVDQDGADGHFGSSVFDLVGDFDDNAEAPCRSPSVSRNGGRRHRPAPDGPEYSPGRRRSIGLRAPDIGRPTPGPVSATVIRTRSPSRRASIEMSAPSSCGVTAYLIAFSISGWSSSEGRRARDRRRIDVEMRAQPVLEAHLLDLEIELQRLDLLRERDLRGRLVDQRVAQEGGQPRQHRIGALGLLQQHQGRDRVQRVEQEMRVELIAQHRQLGGRRLAFEPHAAGRVCSSSSR